MKRLWIVVAGLVGVFFAPLAQAFENSSGATCVFVYIGDAHDDFDELDSEVVEVETGQNGETSQPSDNIIREAFDVDLDTPRGVELIASSTLGGALVFSAPMAGIASAFIGPGLLPSQYRSENSLLMNAVIVTALAGMGGAVLMAAVLVPLFVYNDGALGPALLKAVSVTGASIFGAWVGMAALTVALYPIGVALNIPAALTIAAALLLATAGGEFAVFLTVVGVFAGVGIGILGLELAAAVSGGIMGPAVVLSRYFPAAATTPSDVE